MKSPRNRPWLQSEVRPGKEQGVSKWKEPQSLAHCPQDPVASWPLVQRFVAIVALDKNQIVNYSDGPTSAAAS